MPLNLLGSIVGTSEGPEITTGLSTDEFVTGATTAGSSTAVAGASATGAGAAAGAQALRSMLATINTTNNILIFVFNSSSVWLQNSSGSQMAACYTAV
jgi:hypothetical protein